MYSLFLNTLDCMGFPLAEIRKKERQNTSNKFVARNGYGTHLKHFAVGNKYANTVLVVYETGSLE